MKLLLLVGVAGAMATSPAFAAQVLSLHSTGVSANGTTLANGSTEQNYSLFAAPGGTSGGLRVATAVNGYPFPNWLGDDAKSAWIGPDSNSELDGPFGVYNYQTTFSLAGFNAASAVLTGLWSTDDNGIDIFLNGVSTGNTANGFQSFTPFTISSGFVSGINTLNFIVSNSGGGPTGLRTELSLDANVAAVPEPVTWAMMIAGFGMVGFAMRRRQSVKTSVRFA